MFSLDIHSQPVALYLKQRKRTMTTNLKFGHQMQLTQDNAFGYSWILLPVAAHS